ncbi:MAG: hypothetical protein P4L82_12970 [Ancalomicrobiaceae bacterium]|nr:hypothetical protein [Ancalomicrobiaceae bacterium]
MRLALVVTYSIMSAVSLPNAAQAAACGNWTAAMEEDEGGPRMTASVCVGSGEQPASLAVICFGKTLYMEYSPLHADALPPDGNMEFKAKFTFSDGTRRFEADGQFQAMNGVMGFEWKRTDLLTDMLKSGGTLSIEDGSKHIQATTFPLIGAKAAIERLENSCK